MDWPRGKSEEEKRKLMEEARKGANAAKAWYRERRKVLQKEKLEKLKKKQALSALTQLGLTIWTKVEEVDSELEKIAEERDKHGAVLAQINVQKFVLLSKGRRQLFQQTQTVNGQKIMFSTTTLISNLKEIISLIPGLSDEPQQSSSLTATPLDIRPKILEQ